MENGWKTPKITGDVSMSTGDVLELREHRERRNRRKITEICWNAVKVIKKWPKTMESIGSQEKRPKTMESIESQEKRPKSL